MEKMFIHLYLLMLKTLYGSLNNPTFKFQVELFVWIHIDNKSMKFCNAKPVTDTICSYTSTNQHTKDPQQTQS